MPSNKIILQRDNLCQSSNGHLMVMIRLEVSYSTNHLNQSRKKKERKKRKKISLIHSYEEIRLGMYIFADGSKYGCILEATNQFRYTSFK